MRFRRRFPPVGFRLAKTRKIRLTAKLAGLLDSETTKVETMGSPPGGRGFLFVERS